MTTKKFTISRSDNLIEDSNTTIVNSVDDNQDILGNLTSRLNIVLNFDQVNFVFDLSGQIQTNQLINYGETNSGIALFNWNPSVDRTNYFTQFNANNLDNIGLSLKNVFKFYLQHTSNNSSISLFNGQINISQSPEPTDKLETNLDIQYIYDVNQNTTNRTSFIHNTITNISNDDIYDKHKLLYGHYELLEVYKKDDDNWVNNFKLGNNNFQSSSVLNPSNYFNFTTIPEKYYYKIGYQNPTTKDLIGSYYSHKVDIPGYDMSGGISFILNNELFNDPTNYQELQIRQNIGNCNFFQATSALNVVEYDVTVEGSGTTLKFNFAIRSESNVVSKPSLTFAKNSKYRFYQEDTSNTNYRLKFTSSILKYQDGSSEVVQNEQDEIVSEKEISLTNNSITFNGTPGSILMPTLKY